MSIFRVLYSAYQFGTKFNKRWGEGNIKLWSDILSVLRISRGVSSSIVPMRHPKHDAYPSSILMGFRVPAFWSVLFRALSTVALLAKKNREKTYIYIGVCLRSSTSPSWPVPTERTVAGGKSIYIIIMSMILYKCRKALSWQALPYREKSCVVR